MAYGWIYRDVVNFQLFGFHLASFGALRPLVDDPPAPTLGREWIMALLQESLAIAVTSGAMTAAYALATLIRDMEKIHRQ